MAENTFYAEVPDEILAKAAENAKVNSCNLERKGKEEKKAGNRFVELSEDDLDKIVGGISKYLKVRTQQEKKINCSTESHLLQLCTCLTICTGKRKQMQR